LKWRGVALPDADWCAANPVLLVRSYESNL
jgi:hypothetical protein